jgi:hypothetical protein
MSTGYDPNKKKEEVSQIVVQTITAEDVDDEDDPLFHEKEKKKIKVSKSFIFNTACFVIFIGIMIFVYFQFINNPKEDVLSLGGLSYKISDEFVYEKRSVALQNSLRRLAEGKKELFNFDNSPTTEFLLPSYNEKENGVLVDKLAYQRDAGRSFFGVLRFFRNGRVNYIVRAEVPVGEKLRALPILNSDTFLVLNIAFVRRHWEGNDQYTKGDISRTIIGLRDELQRNSPMQYPHLEREIKSVLAQALYEKNRNIYEEAESLLLNLREKQQHWYNSQKIRWISAVRENNSAEKFKIKNDCEAVFSVDGDKRRYDILREHWE